MGTLTISPNDFTSILGDRIGYKSGLALTRPELVSNLDKKDPVAKALQIDSHKPVRMRSDEIENAFQTILYRLGSISRPFVGHAPTLLQFECQENPAKRHLLDAVLKLLGKYHYEKGCQELGEAFQEQEFYSVVTAKLPAGALDMAKRLIELIRESEEASPWNWFNTRPFNWKNSIELKGLFESESLVSMYRTFLNQRFIDYLASNTECISGINWRKFEGLTAEYFERKGYKVDIGPGRNDGGIDVRVWPSKSKKNSPPIILVQCKRQKDKVGKVVVKSLWADLCEERAKSGMIVTSSYLSPGAREVCVARSYPISEANKDTLRLWLSELRTPGKGVFLGT